MKMVYLSPDCRIVAVKVKNNFLGASKEVETHTPDITTDDDDWNGTSRMNFSFLGKNEEFEW